jgi:hypothetical protein
MRKYRPPLSEEEKKELKRLASLDFSGWTEADVREEFIVPLLVLLGYRKDRDYSISREESYRLNPLFLQVGRDRIKLDYLCTVRKQKFWIIEAKPGGDPKHEKLPEIGDEDIAQAYFYSQHSSVDARYFIVTNGWYIHLYDRDEMNEHLHPIISIRHNDLENSFELLDRYIGSTQLLYTLKSKILKDIETTLSAEVYLDRLDEFIEEVNNVIGKTRPMVLTNFRANALKQDEIWKDNLKRTLLKEDLDLLISSLLNCSLSFDILYFAVEVVADRYIKADPGRQFLFLETLLVKKIRCVKLQYYYNALLVLITLRKHGVTTLPHYQETLSEIINKWIEMCLFHFWHRKDLRHIWYFEGLVGRAAIRSAFLTEEIRGLFLEQKKADMFLLPEEQIAWRGPSPAGKVIEFVDKSIINALDKLINKYFDNGNEKIEILSEEIKKFEDMVTTIENSTEKKYKTIRSELGPAWSELEWYGSINHYFDKLSSGVCDILQSYPEILKELPDSVKSRIVLQSQTGFVNFAKECANIIQFDNKVEIDLDAYKAGYFKLDTNPYQSQSDE